MSRMTVNVGKMPNRVGQLERVTLRAVNSDSLLIMASRRIKVIQVPLDLTKARERLRQIRLSACLATKINRIDQVPPGVVKPLFLSCLKGLPKKVLRCIGHGGPRLSGELSQRRSASGDPQ